MRTTTFVLFCSLAACAPVGGGGSTNTRTNPDAGTGSGDATCTTPKTVTADWSISSMSDFSNVPSTCYQLAGALTISTSDVTSLSKLGDLREVQDLTIDSTALAHIDTMSAIHVTGNVTITNNTDLTDLSNLHVDTTDTLQDVTVTGNDALTSLGNLNRPGTIEGAVEVGNNGALTTVDFSQVQHFMAGLDIHDNAAATTLRLTNLVDVTGNFTIQNMGALTSLGAMSKLQSVFGSFIIDTNKTVASLADSMVATNMVVAGDMQITNNALLTNLGELAHSSRIGGELIVENNAQLTYCSAREIGCCVAHTSDVISGNKTNNDNGCAHSWCYAANNNSCPYQY